MISRFEARSIVSLISGKLKVKIATGKNWAYHFNTKTVTYREIDLSVIDDQDVISNLLHECGHAKYSTSPIKLGYKFIKDDAKNIKDYRNLRSKFHFVLNLVEDFRIEDLVRGSYPFASDYLPEYSFKTLWEINNMSKAFNEKGKKPPKFIQYLLGAYVALGDYKTVLTEDVDKDVAKVVAKTKLMLIGGRLAKNTAGTLKALEEVYPHIKKWMLEFKNVAKLKKSFSYSIGGAKKEVTTYEYLYGEVKTLINPLVEILRKNLTDNMFNRLSGRYRTGKGIDNRVLYKARLGLSRIFTRVVEAKTKDYVVALVIDESGSMTEESWMEGGGKNMQAAKGSVLFANALDKLGIPFSVFGFNSGVRCYKKPDESLSVRHHQGFVDNYKNSYSSARFSTGRRDDENDNAYNCDGFAIKTVKESMRGYMGKKIMIVMTDGHPWNPPDKENDLRVELKLAESEGVRVFGIGVGRDVNVKEFYQNSIQAMNIADVPKALGKILIKALR